MLLFLLFLFRGSDHRPGARTESADGERDRRAEDIATLLALAQRWEAETDGSLPEFLDTVALTEEDAPTGAAAEVLGLTLHAAKGLEFDTVVIVGAEEGLMPTTAIQPRRPSRRSGASATWA